MEELERVFHKAMINVFERARDECNFKPTYFLKMVTEHGGLEAAKRLIASSKPSDGFTKLWELKRLDISVEAVVLSPEFSVLFTDEEKNQARIRLKSYGYTPA
ncbi:hypothetical protein [Geomobilimonas luticola]|uniref:Uncharacterized protein n=1 Tax=Geomobilimonas luticola TaxID=1114878 RepID=A0ABS5SAB7_9BACT|nr:hypothetical protein [Geomobilimonas luticola]MBT0651541.1 hypothetical protein [Geomobilimonas luticola]